MRAFSKASPRRFSDCLIADGQNGCMTNEQTSGGGRFGPDLFTVEEAAAYMDVPKERLIQLVKVYGVAQRGPTDENTEPVYERADLEHLKASIEASSSP
jgi:hypothetical protein